MGPLDGYLLAGVMLFLRLSYKIIAFIEVGFFPFDRVHKKALLMGPYGPGGGIGEAVRFDDNDLWSELQSSVKLELMSLM